MIAPADNPKPASLNELAGALAGSKLAVGDPHTARCVQELRLAVGDEAYALVKAASIDRQAFFGPG